MAAPASARSDLMAAIRGLSAARDLPPEVIVDALKAALISAYHKIPGATATNVTVEIDEHSGDSRVYSHHVVVEAAYLEDEGSEMTLEQARLSREGAQVGDEIVEDVTPADFGRIAAQTAKQVILQRIREAEREQTYSTYADREGEIVYGTVQTINRDVVTVALDRVEAVLPKSGQIPGEHYLPNQRLRVYVSEVKRSPKGPQVVVSRTQREMLKRLMELEIPEIFQGAVEIKGIAREAGSRSKVAVWAHQHGVDPVGACVGMRGVRIQALVRELGGEKIDIVEWDPDPRVFIAHALSPSKVMYVRLEEAADRRTANVVVPDTQLSLAIGREGQNARLAAKLTGWRIDIRAESEAGELLDHARADEAALADERARQAAEILRAAVAAAAVAAEADEALPAIEAAAAATPTETDVEPVAAQEAGEASQAQVEPAAVEAQAPDEAAGVAAAASVAPAAAAPSESPATPTGPETAPPAVDMAWRKIRVDSVTGDIEEEVDSEYPKTGGRKRKKRKLVRDPLTGLLVAEKERKGSRQRPEWEDDLGRWTEDDLDDSMGFTESDFLRADEGAAEEAGDAAEVGDATEDDDAAGAAGAAGADDADDAGDADDAEDTDDGGTTARSR